MNLILCHCSIWLNFEFLYRNEAQNNVQVLMTRYYPLKPNQWEEVCRVFFGNNNECRKVFMSSSLMKRFPCCSLKEVFTLEGTLSAPDHRGSSTDSLIPICLTPENNLLSPLDPSNHHKPASHATTSPPPPRASHILCIPPFLPTFNKLFSHSVVFTFSFTLLTSLHFYSCFQTLLPPPPPCLLALHLISVLYQARTSQCLRSSLKLPRLAVHL